MGDTTAPLLACVGSTAATLMQTLDTKTRRHVPVKEAATEVVPARERLRYWESYTTSELVGLRCSTYAEDGLNARQRNFDLGTLRIADIVGNEHLVERTKPIVRRHPKHSLFACLLLEGEAFFYQSGHCTLVHSGDLIIYGTEKPYLYGFTRPMRQLMVDIKADELFDQGETILSDSLLKIDGRLRAGQMLTQPMRDRILDFIAKPLAAHAASFEEEIRARLRLLLRPRDHGAPRGNDVIALRLLRAERFIADHLGHSELDAEAVASHMAMSLRNLDRVFEQHGCSVTQWIWHERLSLAHRQLADPAHASASIGDIALGCGFATQAHFARAFKLRFDMTPTQHRLSARGAQD